MIVSCKFGNVQFDCRELFKEALLDEGLCCVFNVLHPYYLYKGRYTLASNYQFGFELESSGSKSTKFPDLLTKYNSGLFYG